jgi:hypothetical protein
MTPINVKIPTVSRLAPRQLLTVVHATDMRRSRKGRNVQKPLRHSNLQVI